MESELGSVRGCWLCVGVVELSVGLRGGRGIFLKKLVCQGDLGLISPPVQDPATGFVYFFCDSGLCVLY